ncbi:MAG: BTAD domain-containing putative transcriptional regulator, partial [Actinomycetota bacterium]
MQFRVLGPIEAEARARRLELGSTKQRALLTLLLLHANRPVSADTLVEDLWGAAAPARAAATLHAYVSRLRRGLEPARPAGARGGVLVTQAGGYALRVGPDELDAWRFEHLVAAGRAALAAGQVADAADLLRQGLALWRGPAYGEFATAHFAMAEAARLEELRRTAIEDHCDAGLRLGQHGALVGELERTVAADRLRERPAGQLMVALYRSGRQGEALAVYQSTRRALVDQLGVEPGPELRELEAAVLRQDPELSSAATVAPPVATAPGQSAPQVPPEAWLRPPLPPVITAGSRVPFVGREPELARLQRAWRDCALDGTRLVLVTGEPGIGKSRLVGHVAGLAYQEGATVLWGRATEEAVISYQAFADALEPLAAAMFGQPAQDLGAAASRLGRLLPTVAARLPSPAFVAKPDVERYLLFEGVRWLLGAAAATGPVVLVLEDLHWADRSGLALLSHLLRRPVDVPLLVLVTYREMELDDDHPLGHLVAELAGEPWSDQVELVGLHPDVVAELIGAWGGRTPTESFCRAIAAPSDGNPFYVVEILRHLDESGRTWETVPSGPGEALTLPPTVRTVIERRLGRLSNGAQQALRAAAVVGRDFDVRVLSFVLGSHEEQLTTALEEAVRARLIVELPNAPGRCTFSHALVRETTYRGLAAPRRARLHRRGGAALEA